VGSPFPGQHVYWALPGPQQLRGTFQASRLYYLVTLMTRTEVDVEKNVKPALREILARSHVGAVAIVVLLILSSISLVRAISTPLPDVADYVATAVAILGVPARGFTRADRMTLIAAAGFLIDGWIAFAAAWLLSWWVYGVGPFRSLSLNRTRITRNDHA
jgi:hypothetical protein